MEYEKKKLEMGIDEEVVFKDDGIIFGTDGKIYTFEGPVYESMRRSNSF